MIGSHNSMSYLPVRQWYLKPFGWMARCQSKTLNEQFYIYGVRLFDFRVRFDKDGGIIYAHGPFKFGDRYGVELAQLDRYAELSKETVYCRIILESNGKMKDQDRQETLFKQYCERIVKRYPNVTFFGGNRKYDWKVIYQFNTQEPELLDLYSSTTNIFGGKKDSWTAKLDDFWPWLYAKLYNKKNYARYDGTGVLFLDFVNIK